MIRNKTLKIAFFLITMPVLVEAQKNNNMNHYSVKVATLSNGKCNEFVFSKPTEDVGGVLYDTRTGKLIGFAPDEMDSMHTPIPAEYERWLSIDPHAEKYSSVSPYAYAFNNPILYVDPDGRDNVIYLVIATDKKGKASISEDQAKKIMTEANKIYEKLGVKTRVSLYQGKGAFNPKNMDKTDGVAVMGKTKQQTTDYIKKNISSKFGEELETANFHKSTDNPEYSQNDHGQGGNIIATGFDAIKDAFGFDPSSSDEKKAGFTIVHGSGHNAKQNHGYGIMSGGNKLMYSGNPLNNYINNGVSNEDLIKGLRQRFGNNESQDNYEKNSQDD